MNSDLDTLREQIDEIDLALIDLLQRRMETVSRIAGFKKHNHMPVLDRTREASKMDSIASCCPAETAKYICRVFGSIIEESRSFQDAILEDPDG